jgi:hypothetical protein
MPLPQLTSELHHVILNLAKQPDIHSISCPFVDYDLWEALLQEQVRRSQVTGLPYQEALYLSGPDSGIRGMERATENGEEREFAPPSTGGYVHIPWQGATGADLFIVPAWRVVRPGAGPNPEKLGYTVGTSCNYVLSHRDLGAMDCALRTIVAEWFLYKSVHPCEDCNPIHVDERLMRNVGVSFSK